jgi:spermidine/putrescine-binding protein
MPAGAPHPQAERRFLNFMLDAKVIAGVTNDIHYGNDNRAADAFVQPAILANPAIYPTPTMVLSESHEVSAATERLRTRTWTRIKTGN